MVIVGTEIVLDTEFDITNFLVKTQLFKTLLRVKQDSGKDDVDILAQIRNINLFSKDFALSPQIDEESFKGILKGLPAVFSNEKGNVSFMAMVKNLHGSKLLMSELPKQIIINNLRESERYRVDSLIVPPLKFQNLAGPSNWNEATILDISKTGVSFQMPSLATIDPDSRLKLTFQSDYAFLNNCFGRVVYIKKVQPQNNLQSFFKVAIKLDKEFSMDKVEKALPLL